MRVLMVVKSGVTDDARVRREAVALVEAGHHVTVVGDRPGPDHALPGVDVRFCRKPSTRSSWSDVTAIRRLVRWLLLPNHRRRDNRLFVEAAARLCSGITADVGHAHDLRTCGDDIGTSPAFSYLRRPRVLDRRSVGRLEWFGRRFDGRRERRLGRSASVVVTVSDELATWLRSNRGFSDVRVVRNTASSGRGRPAAPSVAHYGGRIDEERDLLTAAAGVALVDGVELMVRGGGDQASIEALCDAGVDVLPPISPEKLVDELRDAGIGLVTLSGGSMNHEVALPNKLFLAVQAGVPVVAADLPALRRVVTEHGLGELYTPGDADSFAGALRSVVERHEVCDRVAASQAVLSWQHDAPFSLQCMRSSRLRDRSSRARRDRQRRPR